MKTLTNFNLEFNQNEEGMKEELPNVKGPAVISKLAGEPTGNCLNRWPS